MTQIKAVIFDMDGVLIDAKEWHYEAMNAALGVFGHVINRYDHLVTYDGLPTGKKLEILSIDRGLPRHLHRFLNDLKQQFTLEMVHAQCRPRFQHEYALSKLRDEGYVIGVASNSVRKTVELMMEKSNLLSYLHFFLSNQDVKRAKPDPEIYRVAMARAGVQPHETVVVEDNHHGIEAATKAGAHVLRVRGVEDVTYERIQAFIHSVQSSVASPGKLERRAA